MAGRGPAPKDPSRLVGHGASTRRRGELTIIHAEPVAQPELPAGYEWPEQTRRWWQMWAESPLSADFTATDWSELLDTALLHAQLWVGDTRVASELRLRVAKFGATPEDRARLRIQFAQADEADERRAKPGMSARDRRGPLKATD
jgi:hypothetical protein